MSIDYDKLFKRLEEKVEEGIALLPRAVIGQPDYKQLIEDIVDTISLVKNFDRIGEDPDLQANGAKPNPNQIKIGDKYKSLDGSPDDRKIVIFSSEGCSFCNQMKPVYLPTLEEANVPVEHVSLDEQAGNEFAMSLGITGIPAYLLVKNGVVTYKFEGYDTHLTEVQNKINLLNTVEKYL